jgi:hypothetical protein
MEISSDCANSLRSGWPNIEMATLASPSVSESPSVA